MDGAGNAYLTGLTTQALSGQEKVGEADAVLSSFYGRRGWDRREIRERRVRHLGYLVSPCRLPGRLYMMLSQRRSLWFFAKGKTIGDPG